MKETNEKGCSFFSKINNLSILNLQLWLVVPVTLEAFPKVKSVYINLISPPSLSDVSDQIEEK